MSDLTKANLRSRLCRRVSYGVASALIAATAAGCARNENYFGDRAASHLSGPTQAQQEPYGTYRGGRDPRTGLATNAAAPAGPAPTMPVTGNAATPAPLRASMITVADGDTLYGLAQKHHVSISNLMAINGLSQAAIHPGQTLRLR